MLPWNMIYSFNRRLNQNILILNMQSQSQNQSRNSNRLFSNIINLKAENFQIYEHAGDAKRKSKKISALKVIYDNHIYQNFIEITHKKDSNDKALILKGLKTHSTFSSIIEDRELKNMMLQKFKLCKVLQGQYLMKQNSNASSFFILHQGKLSLEINGVAKKQIQPGQGFGQLALLYSAPRSGSIKALKSSYLWYIDRQTFRNALSSLITKNYKENRLCIEKNPFFKYLTSCQKDKLASIAISQRFDKGSQICKEGQLAASMFIIKSGKLAKYQANQSKGFIFKGNSFEEYTVLAKGCLRNYTIKVLEESEIIALGVQDIQNALGKSLPLVILRNQAKNAIKKSHFLQKLSDEYCEKLIDSFKLKNVKSGEILTKAQDLCKKLIFFVAEGQHSISDQSKKSSLYGQKSLQNQNEKYNVEIKMKEKGKIAWTTLQQIKKSFGCSLQQALNKSKIIEKVIKQQKSNQINLHEVGKKIKLQSLSVLKKLGQGQFGNVFLVKNNESDKVYALKCISKHETIKQKLQKHLINEKEALSVISSNFIMEFIRSYKDQNYIYFLTQFINGIQLFDAIRIIGLLNPQQTIFYAAQLLHIVETMHEKNIIYRDLKPENIMVCHDGYLKLIDLGTCKRLNGNEKTFTMIGTPNYMAPETLAGKGYSFPVDLWSLGIIMFQFMAGYVPFGDDIEDPIKIYEQIIKNELRFPKHMKDPHVKAFISVILSKNPETRLGGSFNKLKNHEIFSNMQWHELITKKLDPSFLIPEDKLLDLKKIGSKQHHLSQVLQPQPNLPINRKDLAPNWDSVF